MTNAMAREILRLSACASTTNFPFSGIQFVRSLSHRSPLHAFKTPQGRVAT